MKYWKHLTLILEIANRSFHRWTWGNRILLNGKCIVTIMKWSKICELVLLAEVLLIVTSTCTDTLKAKRKIFTKTCKNHYMSLV